MAKKNSTKTATKEALQNSEPRLIAYRGWQGINIQESPLKWEPIEEHSFKSSNLPTNYLILQNNVDSMDGGGLETRNPDKTYVMAPSGPDDSASFTGVQLMKDGYLYAAFDDSSIRVNKAGDSSWAMTFDPAIQRVGDSDAGYQDPDQKWVSTQTIIDGIMAQYPNEAVDYSQYPISDEHQQYVVNVFQEYILPGLCQNGINPYRFQGAGVIAYDDPTIVMCGQYGGYYNNWCTAKDYIEDGSIVPGPGDVIISPFINLNQSNASYYIQDRGFTEAFYNLLKDLVTRLEHQIDMWKTGTGSESFDPEFWLVWKNQTNYYHPELLNVNGYATLKSLYEELISLYFLLWGGYVKCTITSYANPHKWQATYSNILFNGDNSFSDDFENSVRYLNQSDLESDLNTFFSSSGIKTNIITWTDLAIINDDFIALGARFTPNIEDYIDAPASNPQILTNAEDFTITGKVGSIVVKLAYTYSNTVTINFSGTVTLPGPDDNIPYRYDGGDIWTGKLNRIDTTGKIMDSQYTGAPLPTMIRGELASTIDGKILHLGNRRAIGTPDNDNFYVANNGNVLTPGNYQVTWGTFFYTYTNKFGQTMWDTATLNDYSSASTQWIYNGKTFKQANVMDNMYVSPLLFNSIDYLTLGFRNIPGEAEGIDIYWAEQGSTDQIWIGHIESSSFKKLNEGQPNEELVATLDWYGSLNDTTDWTNANLVGPDQDTTGGVPATMCAVIDNRLYFWGDLQHPERLYIGGTAFHELSIARGTGGAYIDISPGYGQIVHGAYKFKTQSGASIVTILTGNRNTNDLKRFNLVQTNITVTSDLSETSFMAEEVSNVVGCNSDYGAVVAADGLYTVHRYGVTITTHAMEYNSQLKIEMISDAIEPLFDDRRAYLFDNAHMIYIDDKLYIVLASPDDEYTLDHVILVYDIGLKAWYTYTYPVDPDGDYTILSIFPIDYVMEDEGIGIVMQDRIAIIPTAGSTVISDALDPVQVLIQTGELSTTNPLSQTSYVDQLEFRFDYFIGNITIHLNGVDYFGRTIHIEKHISHDDVVRDLMEWMKVGRYLESYNITITGNARFHLTHFMGRVFVQNKRVHSVYGYDSHSSHYRVEHGEQPDDHDDWHEIKNYNDLHRAVVV